MVADFGIAVAISAAGGGRMTETGLSLGTPHYMSPEQASADRDLSARSDVYSLGCVLYEMLAGQPPHTGPSAQSVLVRILTEDPRNLTELRRTVPPNVAAVVMKSIEKLPADRFDSASEFRAALDDESFSYTVATRARPAPAVEPTDTEAGSGWLADRRSQAAVAVIVVLGALAGTALLTGGDEEASPQPTVRATVQLDDERNWDRQGVRISADGNRIAINTIGGVMSRALDQPDFRLMPGTEDADRWIALSPDGEWVAFVSGGNLFKIAASASSPITLVRIDEIDPSTPHWGEDGTIVFGDQGTWDLWRVSSTGGDAERLGEGMGRSPFLLPDGSGVLFTTQGLGIGLLDMETREAVTLLEEAVDPQYVDTGHVLFGHPEGGLFALPFDLDTHEVTGAPIPVLDEVGVSGRIAFFTASSNGTLVFSESLSGSGLTEERIVLMDPDGGMDTVRIEPRSIDQVRFSADGRRLSFNSGGGNRSDDRQIWIYDIVSESLRQLSFEGGHRGVWSPDGGHIAYSSEGPETSGEDLWIHPSDGGADPIHLDLGIPGDEHAEEWAQDSVLVFSTQGDLYAVNPLAQDPQAYPWVEAEYGEFDFDLDPSGRFAVYTSLEFDRPEIFVRDFPTPQGKWRISSEGGRRPVWSGDGQSIFYQSLDNRSIVRVDLEVGAGVVPLGREVVWQADEFGRWDLDRDTGRAASTVPASSGPSGDRPDGNQFWIVVNWFEELNRLTGQAP